MNMGIQPWTEVYTSSLQNLWVGVIQFLPNVFFAALIFIIGWVIASIAMRLIEQIVSSLKVDEALKGAGLEEMIHRAGYKLNTGFFLGALIKWFIVIAFLIASLEKLGFTQVNIFLQEVVLLYLPQVIAAVLIIIVAAVIAEAAQSVVVGAARAANLKSAHFAGTVTRWAIWIFALLAALNQLSVASVFVQTFFTGFVVAVSLALGLAFGLGGQDAAKHYIEKMRDDMTKRH